MKLRIGEVSRMTGISASGIRFYEDAGIITPVRRENKKYRDFSLQDLQLLLVCRTYRDCGFSLHESVELLTNMNTDLIKEQMERQCLKISQEIKNRQVLSDVLIHQIKAIKLLQNQEHACLLTQNPALLRIKLWQPELKDETTVPFPLVAEWMELLPLVESCLILSETDFSIGEGELKTNWGVAIEERHANLLNFHPKARLEYIPSQKCVQTFIRVSGDMTIMSEQLLPAREFIALQQMETNGHAISRRFLNVHENNQFLRYDQLWIPVKEIL